MPSKVAIKSEIDLINTIKILTQVYQEIAVIRMQKSRKSVLLTRDFLNKLLEIFFEVKKSYKKELDLLIKQKKILKKSSKKKQEVSILISSNAKLYGEIVGKVYRKFINSVKDKNTDIMIIGRLGRDLFEDENINKPYSYFEIPDAEVTMEDLKAIIFHLIDYEKINVYYGKFESIGIQHPEITNISGDEPLNANTTTSTKERSYLFEPDLKTIYEYFEKQTASSLLKQTVHESQLARYASRIMAMEEAYDNISSKSRELYSSDRKTKKLIQNRKQLETMSGLMLWSGK